MIPREWWTRAWWNLLRPGLGSRYPPPWPWGSWKSGGTRPGWHPVLQPFRNVDIGYKPWLPSICCQNLRGKHTVQLNQIGKFRQIAVFLHCFILLLLGFHAIPWYALLMVEENHLITNLLLGAVIHTPWTSVGGYGGILRHTYFNSQYGLNLEGAVPRVSKHWGI